MTENNSEIKDIENIVFTDKMTKEERMAYFIEQIGNPYVFKCGDITVKIRYAENGPSFEDCFKEYMDSLDI